MSVGRVGLFRMVFFGLVALDAWFGLGHAARYGAGDFNVSHLPWLDNWLPLPRREVMVCLWIGQIWLAIRLALGVGSRRSAALLAGLYAGTYLISQLDSYQHHYLVLLLLLVLAWVPWEREEEGGWPFRLVLIQLSLVYAFAFVTKLDPLWWRGELMPMQVAEAWPRALVDFLAPSMLDEKTAWSLLSVASMAVELFLVVALQVPRLRSAAAVVGIGFHLGIEQAGLRIGLFSWFLLAVFLLALPSRWMPRRDFRLAIPEKSTAFLGVMLLAGLCLVYALPFEAPLGAVAVVAVLVLVGETPRRPGLCTRGLGHLLACALLFGLSWQTDVPRDYYKYLGGDARRRGDLTLAIKAYTQVVALDPAYLSGQVRLGDLYRRRGELETAADLYARARALDPVHTTVIERQLRVFRALDRTEEARRSAQQLLAIEPDNREALELLGRTTTDQGED